MNNTTHNPMNETTINHFRQIRKMAEHASVCADRPNNTIDVLLDELKPAMTEAGDAVAYLEIERAYMVMTEAMNKFHTLVYRQCEVARETCTLDEAMVVITELHDK